MIDIITFILILQILMIILHLINAKKFSNIYHNVNITAMNSMISSQNSAKDMIMSEAIIEIMKMKEEMTKSEEVKGDEVKDDEMKGDEVKGDEMKGDEVKGEEVKGDEVKDDEMKGEEVTKGVKGNDEVKDYETKTIDKFLNQSTREIIMEEAAHDAKVCEMNVKSLK